MFLLILHGLRGRKLRHATTCLGVVLAMGLFSLVLAAQVHTSSLYAWMKGRNNMIVEAKGDEMPLSYKDQIVKVPGVKRLLYAYRSSELTSPDGKTKILTHATTDQYMTISDDWFYVEPGDIQRWNGERTGAILARETARLLNARVGEQFTFNTEFGPLPVVISAISPHGYKSAGMLVHYEYFVELFHKQGKVVTFWTELTPDADVMATSRRVDELFKNTPEPTVSISASANLKDRMKMIKVIPTLLTAAGVLVLIATLLVTANTIAITVRERRAEFATLRAIGFRGATIGRLVMGEVLIVCLVGGMLGAAVPFLVFPGREIEIGSFSIGGVRLGPGLVGLTVLTSLGLALISGAVPAWRAARIPVVDALRANG
jgi:putative ABC transport system permease protein